MAEESRLSASCRPDLNLRRPFLSKLLPILGAQLSVDAGLTICGAAFSLFFQNNLNLLRDVAVLIARDFKSRPVQSPLFVLHRYGGVQGKG